MGNPPFNPALGAAALSRQARPPSRFEGVTARVFPLKANMYRLRSYCSSFLNVAPEIVQFRPAMPYVFLMALDYGRMSAEFANFGWVSQRELAFAVPLEWYDMRAGDGNARFVDYAAFCPYIYVDDETSLSTGRQVYGWPKVRMWAGEHVNPWVYDPLSPQHLLTVRAMMFPELYAGVRQQPTTLLEIRQTDSSALARFPPDPGRAPNPLAALPSVAQGYANLVGAFVEMLTRAPQLGYEPAPDGGFLGLLRPSSATGPGAWTRNPVLNNITLKQFRDAEDPDQACYQALLNSQMRVGRYNAFGPLGVNGQTLGDPSGGLRVWLHRYTAQPIVESLGLDVSEVHAHGGVRVDILQPAYPFWLDLDLEYGIGHHIAWRTKDSEWHVGNAGDEPPDAALGAPSDPTLVPADLSDTEAGVDVGTTVGSEVRTTAASDVGSTAGLDVAASVRFEVRSANFVDEGGLPTTGPVAGSHPRPQSRYNTVRAGALESVAGPFDFPNTTLRVLPLLADPVRLDTFCREYLANPRYQFESWGSYVYVLATTYEDMTSDTNNIGWWADRELLFLVPVLWKEQGQLVSLGLVPAFAFANTSTAAITSTEVKGQPTVSAHLTSPAHAWMNASGPSDGCEQGLLRCDTSVVPALHLGQQARFTTLVEVHRGQPLPLTDVVGWRGISEQWGEPLLAEHLRMVDERNQAGKSYDDAKSLAIELMVNGQAFNFVSLKQFRDAHEPSEACYQAIVRTRRVLQQVFTLEEIEDPLHVYIHRQPAQPIADILGLVPKWTTTRGGAPVDVFQPLRPFWARVSLREELGENLVWRAGELKWRTAAPPWTPEVPPYFDRPGPADVGADLLHQQLGTDPAQYESNPPLNRQHLASTAARWLRQAALDERLSIAQARDAVLRTEPQMILEAVLSAEWMNWGTPRWFRMQRRGELELGIKPDLCVRTDSVGPKPEQNRVFGGLHGTSTPDGWFTLGESPAPWPSSSHEG